MEITIKTAEEFWRDKVSIQISGTAAEVQTVGQRLVRGREPGYWADACEKAERGLLASQREVHELKEARAGDAGTIEALRERIADLEADRGRERQRRAADLALVEQQRNTAQEAREIETRRAQEYDRDRRTERDRADRNGARVKELETELERYRRSHVCTVECKPNQHTAFQGRELVASLETALADAQTRIGELDGQLRRALAEQGRRFTETEVDRAKEGAREDARAEVASEVHELENKLARIRHAVLGGELARELAEYRTASAAMLMVEALTEVRRITGVTSV